MKLYKKYHNSFYLFIIVIGALYIVSCTTSFLGSNNSCKSYKYDSKKQSFVDAFNRPITCSLADNFRIFEYLPDKGCSFWKEHFQLDETVHFIEMVVRSGESGTSLAKKYCVLQRFIEHDKSGQVMLINTNDGGAYCFKAHSDVKNNYVFHTCEDIERKNPNAKNTKTKKDPDKELADAVRKALNNKDKDTD